MQTLDLVSKASGYYVVLIDGVEQPDHYREAYKAGARVLNASVQGHAAHYEPRDIEIHGVVTGTPDATPAPDPVVEPAVDQTPVDPTPVETAPPVPQNPPVDLGSIDDPATWAESTVLTPGATGATVTLTATA